MRPTTDKLRSAIFSILDDKVEDSAVLDGFAGSGAYGLEAYSRGAEFVMFIDKDISSLKQNLHLIEKGKYDFKKGSFFNIVCSLNRFFDIIFIDPPYGLYSSANILQAVRESNILNNDGIIIYEEFFKTPFSVIEPYIVTNERKYGDTIIRFLEVKI